MSRTITVRTMLYWVFLIALIMPYVVALLPRSNKTAFLFSVSVSEVEDWLQEIDPSVSLLFSEHGEGTASKYSSVLSCLVACKSANSNQLMSHLRMRIRQKYKSQEWHENNESVGDSTFYYHLQRFDSNCYLYCFTSGVDGKEQEFLESTQQEGFMLRLLVFSFTQ